MYIYDIYHINSNKKCLYSFTVTIVITVTLQSFTVSVLTRHTSIYTIWMIYFLNHYWICDISIYVYIYIWYISYYSKNCCIHSMLLFVVSLFYSHSLYVYVLLIRVYVLYEWYIFVISINFVMFSCIYMIYIIWIEKEL